ncbi:hypothetical protein AKUH3B203J_02740 [Apilactobacillus kunkeei]|nr:hypothetical protein AKUH3B203J_02740 [Apilactobacillus kunkeei]
MITLGVTTWSEHPALINGEDRPVKLNEYAAHFPVVEVDNPFYGIPQEKNSASMDAPSARIIPIYLKS